MTKPIESNRLILSIPRFYQQLLKGLDSYEKLGSRILKEIKTAHAFRQSERVRELSKVLINFPIKEYRLIGQYYQVWCNCRKLNLQTEALEHVIEHTQTHKTIALITRAGFEGLKGNIDPMFYFYNEALKASKSASDYVETIRCIAALKSQEGFHNSALKDLDSTIPLIRYAEPRIYYDLLNSYAVELGEAGRKDEARNISRLVLASPFAFAYPEWRETAEDLKPANRSFAVINPTRHRRAKILPMPAIGQGGLIESPDRKSVV
jgi:hypothetical protein